MKIGNIKILLIISIVATLLSALVTYIASQVRKDSVNWIIHTHKVIQATDELEILITDLETGQRGFLLTGEQDYLSPYNAALLKVNPKLTLLDSLINDNPVQKKNFEELKEKTYLRIAAIDSALYLYKKYNLEKSVEYIKNSHSNALMDDIRILVAKMIDIEQNLLIKRFDRLGNLTLIFNITRYISLLFIAIMTAFALISLIKKENQNQFLIDELNTANTTLEQKVIERTNDLSAANKSLMEKNQEILAQSEHIIIQKIELEKRNKQLLELNNEKNRFLGIATHDLKSPINRIKGLLNIMGFNQSATVASQKEYLILASKAIDQMLELISNLLDINKIEEGKNKIQVEETNINNLMSDAVLMFQESAQAKDIVIVSEFQNQNVIANTDKSLLLQIMENLISNAIKFSHNNKKITVALKKSNEGFQISVADQGQGIKEEEIGKIFDKFNKLSTKPTAGENSTGLGLSIVKDLVEQLNGKIRCESKIGIGSTFYLDFFIKNTK
jgi:signal transduction histidine kinase